MKSLLDHVTKKTLKKLGFNPDGYANASRYEDGLINGYDLYIGRVKNINFIVVEVVGKKNNIGIYFEALRGIDWNKIASEKERDEFYKMVERVIAVGSKINSKNLEAAILNKHKQLMN